MKTTKLSVNLFLFLSLFITSIAFGSEKQNTIEFTKDELKWIETHPVIRVQNEQDWEPFNYNHNNTPKGHSIDYMRLLGAKIGLDIKFVQGYSWKEYLDMLKTNQIDLMVNIAKTPKREQFFSYTPEYHKVLSSLYVLEENQYRYSSLKDLEGKTVSVVQGMVGESVLRDNYPKIKIYPVKTSLDALKAVIYGEADGVVQSNALGNQLIKKYNLINIKPIFEINDPKFNMHLHLATNKQNTILRDILKKGMSQISQRELLELKEKHFDLSLFNIKEKSVELNYDEKNYLNQKGSIKMCTDPNYPPYQVINENNEDVGIAREIINIISKNTGAKIKLLPTESWSETLEFMDNRTCDIISIAMKTPSRLDRMDFTTPYLIKPLVIATKDDAIFIEDPYLIGDRKVGVGRNYGFIEDLKEKYPNLQIIEVDSPLDGLKMVQKGELFGYIDTSAVITYAIRAHTLLNLKISGELDIDIELRIATRNDEPNLHNIMQKGLSSINKTDLERIVNSWYTIEYEDKLDYELLWKIVFVFILILWVVVWWNRRLQKEIKLKNEASKALRKSNELLLESQQTAHIAHWTFDPYTGIPWWSDELYRIYGRDPAKGPLPYSEHPKLVHPDDWEWFDAIVQDTAQTGKPFNITLRIIKLDGTVGIINSICKPVVDHKGKVVEMRGTIQDITKLKKAEIGAKESEQRFRTLVDTIPDMVWMKDTNGVYLTCNLKYREFLNLSEFEILGKTDYDLYERSIADTYRKNDKLAIEAGKPRSNIEDAIYSDGHVVVLETIKSPVFDPENNLVGVLGIGRDITEQLESQRALKESEERYKAISEQSIVGTYIYQEGYFVYVNKTYAKMLGYNNPKEIIGKIPTMELVAPNSKVEVTEKINSRLEGESYDAHYEMDMIKKDGSFITVEAHGSYAEYKGKPAIVGILIDKTEQKYMEDELAKKEELMLLQSRQAAMGEMISMIAHQWRQPLSVISMDVNNILADIELKTLEEGVLRDTSMDILEQTSELSKTIDDFRNFFKSDKKLQKTNIKDVLAKTFNIVNDSLKNNDIEVKTIIDSTEDVFVYQRELMQVLVNIITNAKDALVHNEIEGRNIHIRVYDEQNYLNIEICDNGGGIKEDILYKVFDPYFTTKHESVGTGLGLYMSKMIIEKHLNGKIKAYNKNNGACFLISLQKRIGC